MLAAACGSSFASHVSLANDLELAFDCGPKHLVVQIVGESLPLGKLGDELRGLLNVTKVRSSVTLHRAALAILRRRF